MSDSAMNTNIQIADWIVGAIAWYLEGHTFGKACFDRLKHAIVFRKDSDFFIP